LGEGLTTFTVKKTAALINTVMNLLVIKGGEFLD
jgi:hypothetical protein